MLTNLVVKIKEFKFRDRKLLLVLILKYVIHPIQEDVSAKNFQ